jgi:hypothetical protein
MTNRGYRHIGAFCVYHKWSKKMPCIFLINALVKSEFVFDVYYIHVNTKLAWTPNVIGWFVVTWLQINAMFPSGQQVKNCCPPQPTTYTNKQNGGTTSTSRNYDFPSLCSNKECKWEEKYTNTKQDMLPKPFK